MAMAMATARKLDPSNYCVGKVRCWAQGGGPGQEAPLVPWQLVWMLDWGWFMLLGLTVVFLPDAPALKVHAVRPPWPCSVYTRRFTLYDRAILRTILRCRSFRFALLLARRQAPRTATCRACTECYRSEKPLAVFATSGLLFF